MTRHVVVLGDVMLDVIVQPGAPVAPSSDTVATIRVTRGGSGANLAIALRSAAHEVIYIGAAGRDAAGDVFSDALARAHVTPRLQLFDGATGTVVSLVARDGQRTMLTDRGVNSRLDETFVIAQLETSFDHLHVSGYLLLDPVTRRTGVRALEIARARGASTSVDVCSVAPLMAVSPRVFLEAVQAASQLFANEDEALALTSMSDIDASMDALAGLFDEVVVTRGPRGALAALGARRFRADAHDVSVVDTTGAGDAATGAYLAARLAGEDPHEALIIAMSVAARVVTGLGALG